ncbi:MAG: DedA family protein [Candidatus Nomurabacteria bacterium GW2011_GWD1_44_10]|nr:MAG: DedA family protein [Candidatus Nomurabacteria bacterium GW2011_GWD1_44_10]
MRHKLQTLKETMSAWAVRHAEGKNAKWWLFGMSFAESSFFPVPPDVLLVAILMTKERARAFYYATITTLGSVLGGLLGYAIGYFLFQTVGVWLVDIYHLETEMITVQKLFMDNAFFAIFVAAFTPIPYKVFTIAGGLFGISIPTFIIASILGRAGRFFAVATVMKYFGGHIARVFYEYFNLISFAIVIVLGVILYAFFL